MLKRSAARRYVELGKPSERYGVAALAAGWASLLPPLAPAAALLAVAASLLGTFLAGRAPERYAGGRKMVFGLLLSLVGMGLFMVEAQFFWRWKVDQAYDARVEVTRYRLSLVGDALGGYRQAMGEYPTLSGIMAAKAFLEPKYGTLVPSLDAFDGAISVDSRPEGFTLSAWPPPRPRTDWLPPPIVVQGGFQPAPAPPPPPPPPESAGEGGPAGSVPTASPAPSAPEEQGASAPAQESAPSPRRPPERLDTPGQGANNEPGTRQPTGGEGP